MPSTREIRRRIRSVKNTAQITKALQLVASSKMRRAQERVEQSRPYAEQLRALVSRLARVTGADVGNEIALLRQRPVRTIGILAITPDSGFSGALPSNVNRKVMLTAHEEQQRLAEQGERPNIDFIAVGRKGRDYLIRTQQHLLAEFTNYGDNPNITDATAIAQVAVDAFLKGEVDIVYLVYAKFVNTMTQQPTAVQLLPVQPPAQEPGAEHETLEYIYEPDAQTIFQALLPRYVDIQVYQALLEAVASFQSARMVAMKNATDNANELIQDLTLTYNKARQASITTQILEIVAGANA
ncbi:MAG TPA: ATP synthase F1 subunit gamma [Ktedonobacteraceae bacterium]|nr:ATP synthase F1 subunit gamma [Ktedonobacteraceae bacterium]